VEFIGIWLTGIGLGDAVAGLGGEVNDTERAATGWFCGSTLALLLSLGWGFSLGGALVAVLMTAVTLGLWLWARRPDEWSKARATWILAVVGLSLTLMLGVSAQLPSASEGWFAERLERLPYSTLADLDPSRVILGIGALFVLQATSNALIRLLLTMVGTSPLGPQDIRGGRIVGALERTLIWALGLAGEMTAAGLVISAKGLLRFPEISREASERLHIVTEYLLVGSLASWSLALAAIALLVA
jgi:multisubunit Na+/H+ antiporter MnhB subunit